MNQLLDHICLYYLNRYYATETTGLSNVITVDYKELTENPSNVLQEVSDISGELFKQSINVKKCSTPWVL